jgi:hypothetical protein
MLTDAFGGLPESSHYAHLASRVLLATTIVR